MYKRFKIMEIPKTAMILASLAFLSDLSNSITLPTVPLLAIKLGASYEFIGIMVAVSALTRLILVQPIGILCDKINKKFLLMLGFLLFNLNYFMLIIAVKPFHLLIGRFFQGVGSAMFYTAALSLLLISSDKNKGLAVGIYTTMMGIGFSIGPIIGGIMAEKMSYNLCYISSMFIALSAIIIIFLGLPTEKTSPNELNKQTKIVEETKYRKLFKNRDLLVTCIGAFFMSEAIGTDMSFFPIYGNNLSLSEKTIGIILGIRALFSTLVRIPIGKYSEKIGLKRLMMIALLSASIGLFLIPQFSIFWLLTLSISLEGIGFGVFMTSANIHIGKITDDKNKGAAIGLYGIFSGLGSVLNMIILGFIAGAFGVENTFRFTSAMCFLGFLLLLITIIKIKDN